MLGLRAAIHADGILEITVGATNTKGVMPCDGSGSSSVAGHNAGNRSRAVGLVVRARLGAEGASAGGSSRHAQGATPDLREGECPVTSTPDTRHPAGLPV
jgi:hypothetical protein